MGRLAAHVGWASGKTVSLYLYYSPGFSNLIEHWLSYAGLGAGKGTLIPILLPKFYYRSSQLPAVASVKYHLSPSSLLFLTVDLLGALCWVLKVHSGTSR